MWNLKIVIASIDCTKTMTRDRYIPYSDGGKLSVGFAEELLAQGILIIVKNILGIREIISGWGQSKQSFPVRL